MMPSKIILIKNWSNYQQ